MNEQFTWQLHLQDNEWPLEKIDHDRNIVRAIVVDDEGSFYFVRVHRDDYFGKATLIETAGGGVEPGEDLSEAIQRELKEELGVEVEILSEIGLVDDYYNLIHRHNLNHYFLCRIRSFGETNMTQQEIEDFHLSTLKMSYQEAADEYRKCACTKLGRLLAQRELPVLERAKDLLNLDCKMVKQNRYFRLRAGALPMHDGKILFVKCSVSDYYYVMGGAIQLCETSKDCIEREIVEETGVAVKAGRLALVTENFFTGAGGSIDTYDCHTIEFYYLMELSDEQAASCKSSTDENEELAWLPISDIQSYNIKPAFVKERLDEILSSDHVLHILEDRDKRK
ncbi:MAG: NUDIX hydrolase [Clostridiales bacterium]|nr:NUDIX hydrolase [Clostridiales bacterium]